MATTKPATTTSSTLQATLEYSDDSDNFFNVILEKIFAVLGRWTSALLNLVFGCLLCVALISIVIASIVAICRRKQRRLNKTSFVVDPGAEKNKMTKQLSSNGRYSLDPMTTGKRQKSVESRLTQQQQQQQQHRDNSSDNDYTNYGADHDDDEDVDLYESIDDIRH